MVQPRESYLTLWLIPQNSEAGLVEVIGVKVMEPVNLEESVPPKVNSPLVMEVEVVGSYDTATRSEEMIPIDTRVHYSATQETPKLINTYPERRDSAHKTSENSNFTLANGAYICDGGDRTAGGRAEGVNC